MNHHAPSVSTTGRSPQAERSGTVPLYVDLDGTLLATDTLHESVLLLLRKNPLYLLHMLVWLLGGKAAFKRKVADAVRPDASLLPYHAQFLGWLKQEHAAGRKMFLATAADARIAGDAAAHLGLFDGVLASNMEGSAINLSSGNKRQAIEQHAQAHGWTAVAYAGNSSADLAVWEGVAQAVAVDAPEGVLRRLRQQHPDALVFSGPAANLRTWLKAVRISQWAKNALLFLPLLAAHHWSAEAWWVTAWAFVAFGLCASATYIVNDLLDLPNDRRHPYKRHRPLAAGRLAIARAIQVALAMLLGAFALAWSVGPAFMAVLGLYTLITLAYSLHLKRLPLLDVLVLSGLYTLRLVAGAVAAGVALSNWLLAISMFLFLGLALVKRCAELEEVRANTEVTRARGRGYHQDDLPALRTMGVASGFLTVMVLALYIDSQNGKELYAQPQWLWGVAPLLLWWIMRIWLKTGRRELHGEDPLHFALRDRFSWATLIGMAVLGGLATFGA